MASKTVVPNNLFFVGSRGAGKSYAIRSLARYRPRFIYIDVTNTVKSYTFTDTDAERLASRMRSDETYDCCLWVGHLKQEQMEESVSVIIDEAKRQDGFVTIAIDEFAVVYPGRRAQELEHAARMGRHHQVSVWLGSQRLTDAHPNLLSAVDKLYVYRLSAPTDYKSVERNLGGKPMAGAIRNLNDYHYVMYDTGSGQWENRTPVN